MGGKTVIVVVQSLSLVQLFWDPMDYIAHQHLLSMRFSRKEYWTVLPFPSPMHESEKWKWSCSVMSDSLWPHKLQHPRLPCSSLSPRVYSDSCPLNWCHPTISSSVTPFSSWLKSFPVSESFPMSQLFTSGDQSIGASGSARVLLVNI